MWIDISLIALIPIALMALNPMVSFANNGHCDVWYYFGYFHILDQVDVLSSSSYRLDRLPGLLPGFLLYKYLPPMTAHYAWFLGHYYLALYALYFAASTTFGRRAALFAALFLGVNRMFIGYVSTTYVGVPALAFAFLSVAFFVRAKRAEPAGSRWLMAIGGLMFMLALATHIKIILYIFMVPLWSLPKANVFTPAFWKQRELRRLAVFGTLGLAVGFITLGAVSVLCFDGRFNLFEKIIERIPKIAAVEKVHMHRTFAEWMALSPAVQFGAVAAICSLYYVLVHYIRRGKALIHRDSLVYAVTFLFFAAAIVAYKISGRSVLKYNKCVWLAVPAYMALAGTVFCPMARVSKRVFVAGAAACVALGLATIIPKDDAWIRVAFTAWGSWAMAGLMGCALVVAVLARVERFKGLGKVLALLLLLLVQMGLTPDNYGQSAFASNSDPVWAKASYRRSQMAMAFLRDLNLAERPKFWVGEPYHDIKSIPRSFEESAFAQGFPVLELRRKGHQYLKAGDLLVIVDKDADILRRANDTLQRSEHLRVSSMTQHTISHGGVDYAIIVGRLHACSDG